MANLCYVEMRLFGREEDILTVAKKLDETWIGDCSYSKDDIDLVNESLAQYRLDGWVKWSVKSSIMNNYTNNEPPLIKLCKDNNIVCEIYSEEPSFEFQEHYLIAGGKVLKEDCVDWQSWNWDELVTEFPDNLKEICRNYDCNMEDLEKEVIDGYLYVGGFENAYVFSNLEKVFSEKCVNKGERERQILYREERRFEPFDEPDRNACAAKISISGSRTVERVER